MLDLFDFGWHADGHWLNKEVSFAVDQVGELDEMLENRILKHVLLELRLVELLRIGEDRLVNLLEAAQGIDWTSFTLWSLEEVFGPWIKPLVWILPWSASSSATGWWVSELSIGTFGVLLLHMGVERWIRKISLVAVFAFEVSACVVVLRSSLAADAAFITFSTFAVI